MTQTTTAQPTAADAVPAIDTARTVARWLHEKKGYGITVLDVSAMSSLADAVVIATATSVRHAQGLASEVLDSVGRSPMEYLGMEGFQQGNWILIDLNDVLVHIFQDESRRFYNLEGLWPEAKPVELDLPQ